MNGSKLVSLAWVSWGVVFPSGMKCISATLLAFKFNAGLQTTNIVARSCLTISTAIERTIWSREGINDAEWDVKIDIWNGCTNFTSTNVLN